MVEKKQQGTVPTWKLLALSPCLIGLAKLLHLWLSEPLAWGIGGFITFMLFYESPPRIGSPPDFRKSVLWSAGCALLGFLVAKVL